MAAPRLFKIIGADQYSDFPERVERRLREKFELKGAIDLGEIRRLADEARESAEFAADSATEANSYRGLAAQSATTTGQDVVRTGEARGQAVAARDAAAASMDAAVSAAINSEGSRELAYQYMLQTMTDRFAAAGSAAEALLSAQRAESGQFLGTQIPNAGVDANTLTTPGNYRFNTAAATASLNMPANVAGVLTVISATGGTNVVTQIYKPYTSAVSNRMFWERQGGQAWNAYSSIVVSEAAGRTISIWDTINNRYQRIYGDTGWRDITSLLENSWAAAAVHIRRFMNEVEIRFSAIDPSARTSLNFMTLPGGFRGHSGTDISNRGMVYTNNGTAPVAVYRWSQSNNNVLSMQVTQGAGLLYGSAVFMTADAWPTQLPGTPYGTIPST